MKTVIAICSTTGPGSGKSTYMRDVVFRHFPEAVHLRFSTPLLHILQIICDLFGVTWQDYETIKRTEIIDSVSGRDILVGLGEGLRARLGADFFARILKWELDRLPDGTMVVIDDLRKLPEVETLLSDDTLRVLFVNVLKPWGGYNDTEFKNTDLYGHVARVNEADRVRLLQVTWNGDNSFRKVSSYPERIN